MEKEKSEWNYRIDYLMDFRLSAYDDYGSIPSYCPQRMHINKKEG